MTTDEDAVDDLRPEARVDVDRIDFGDLAQQVEADGADDLPLDEPLELVDAPVPMTGPKPGPGRRGGQRRQPT